MMPFSVLRMWSLGLIGWGLLVGGAYLVYEWSNSNPPPQPVRERVDHRQIPTNDAQPEIVAGERPITAESDAGRHIPLLIWGVILVAASVMGAHPFLFLMGRPPRGEPHFFETSRSQTLTRPDGSELHVEHYGPESAPTVILTHGWGQDRTAWYYVQKALQNRFHLVLWDLAGLGKSTGPQNRDHSLEKMAGDLEAVVREATQGPVVLVGHSIGGMVQQTFSRLFPSQLNTSVRGLVFVHTTYTNPLKTAAGSSLWTTLQKPLIEPLNHLTIWLSPLMWLSNWQSYFNGSLHLSMRLWGFAGRQTFAQMDYASRLQARACPAIVARGSLAMLAFDERQTLPQIHVPALVVSARHDRLTRSDASDTIAHLLPNAIEVTLSPAGHLGHWEEHSEFCIALTSFFDSLASAAPVEVTQHAVTGTQIG
jgi:pimeloyl-ACP methyl ester carboxylesterase